MRISSEVDEVCSKSSFTYTKYLISSSYSLNWLYENIDQQISKIRMAYWKVII